MEYIFWIFFFLFAFGVPFGISRWIRRNRLPDDPIEGIEGLADTDLVCVPYKGEWITLSKMEYLNRWMRLGGAGKRKVYINQMRRLKQGNVKKHYFGDGKMYQILPTEKGKDFEKIHRLKDKIYREEK
jgi:hypothetical protein